MALKIRLRSAKQAVKEKLQKTIKESKPRQNPRKLASKPMKKA